MSDRVRAMELLAEANNEHAEILNDVSILLERYDRRISDLEDKVLELERR